MQQQSLLIKMGKKNTLHHFEILYGHLTLCLYTLESRLV